jgi:hypothetical protein
MPCAPFFGTENATVLTSVVSQDPTYVYFHVDEPTMRTALLEICADKLPTPV